MNTKSTGAFTKVIESLQGAKKYMYKGIPMPQDKRMAFSQKFKEDRRKG
jgi:hypothetical protein